MRKKDENLHDTLLACARELAARKGPEAVGMREIAKMAGVATGTVYNYFASKEDILLALTEAHWQDTLQKLHSLPATGPFYEQVAEIYHFLRQQVAGEAGALMGSLGRAEGAGRARMQAMQKGLLDELYLRLCADITVRDVVWNAQFTPEKYVNFVLMNLMMALRSGAREADFLVLIIQRTLYVSR